VLRKQLYSGRSEPLDDDDDSVNEISFTLSNAVEKSLNIFRRKVSKMTESASAFVKYCILVVGVLRASTPTSKLQVGFEARKDTAYAHSDSSKASRESLSIWYAGGAGYGEWNTRLSDRMHTSLHSV